MEDHESKVINELWLDFKTSLQGSIDKFVPEKTISNKTSLPWITQDRKYKKNRTSQ